MPNIGDIIMHNKAILHQTYRKTQTVDKLCNYRNPSTCLLERRRKEGPIMYKATLTLQNKSMVYYEFEDKKHATELSKAIWNIKDDEETPLTLSCIGGANFAPAFFK